MASKRPILTILIPVYNEQATILDILKKTTALDLQRYEVIVVDDASTDSSLKIINKFAAKFKSDNCTLTIKRHLKNKGKGAGIKTGINLATGRYFVVQDADKEYDPNDIPALLESAKKSGVAAVYGSRFLGVIKDMPSANYIANRFYNILLHILYGVKMTDMHTCYKLVETSVLRHLKLTANGFDYATELISKLLINGYEIKEVPISFHGRTKQEGKKINFMDGIECLYKLILYRLFPSNKLFYERDTTAVRFLIVGTIGFSINYLILAVISELGHNHVVAEIIAMITALQITFLLHDRWTYKLHTKLGAEAMSIRLRYISYIASNIVGAGITIVVFSLLYGHIYRLPALLAGAILGLVWNYLVNLFTWRSKTNRDNRIRA